MVWRLSGGVRFAFESYEPRSMPPPGILLNLKLRPGGHGAMHEGAHPPGRDRASQETSTHGNQVAKVLPRVLMGPRRPRLGPATEKPGSGSMYRAKSPFGGIELCSPYKINHLGLVMGPAVPLRERAIPGRPTEALAPTSGCGEARAGPVPD